MHEALALASEAARANEVPVGAVIAKNDTILARARNRMEELQDASAHAEMLALRQAAQVLGNWRMDDCTLIVTLEPCIMCCGGLILSRMKSVYFAAPDPRLGAMGSLFDLSDCEALPHHIDVYSGVLAEESQKLLGDFFRERRSANKL